MGLLIKYSVYSLYVAVNICKFINFGFDIL